MRLSVHPERYAVVRLDPDDDVPAWAEVGTVSSVTRTASELSIVCVEAAVPTEASAERGWRMLEVAGPLAFTLTGVVSSLTVPLAAAEIPLFVISTFETDYLLVREPNLPRAAAALRDAGHAVDPA